MNTLTWILYIGLSLLAVFSSGVVGYVIGSTHQPAKGRHHRPSEKE